MHFPHDESAMNSSSIVNKSQVANSSIAMVTCVREIVQLSICDSGMRRLPNTSRNLDFCDKGKRHHPSVPLGKQRFWHMFIPLDSHSPKFLK